MSISREMQRLQFSISWLQTTEVSFTSVLETEVKIFLHPPHWSNPPPLPPSPKISVNYEQGGWMVTLANQRTTADFSGLMVFSSFQTTTFTNTRQYIGHKPWNLPLAFGISNAKADLNWFTSVLLRHFNSHFPSAFFWFSLLHVILSTSWILLMVLTTFNPVLI